MNTDTPIDPELEYATERQRVKRGYIPSSVQPTDNAKEISIIYGVSYATASIWLRILRGPKLS